jgi:hypothetical protein
MKALGAVIAALVLAGCSGPSASRPPLPNVPNPGNDAIPCMTIATLMKHSSDDRV